MNALTRYRKKIGINQVQAAQLVGVSRRTYQTYEERGKLNDVYDEILAKLKEKAFSEDGKPLLFTIKNIKAVSSQIFAKYQQVQCAYLIGSYARGEATKDSDIDILVVAPGLEGLDFAGLHHDLRMKLGKEIDLISHTTLLQSEKMLRDLLIQGVKIYGQRTNPTKNR